MGKAKRKKGLGFGAAPTPQVRIQKVDNPASLDEGTARLLAQLRRERPNARLLPVRISEGEHFAVGVVWWVVKQTRPGKFDDLTGGMIRQRHTLESGIGFAVGGVPESSVDWVKAGAKSNSKGVSRFNHAVDRFARSEVTAS